MIRERAGRHPADYQGNSNGQLPIHHRENENARLGRAFWKVERSVLRDDQIERLVTVMRYPGIISEGNIDQHGVGRSRGEINIIRITGG
jgi:hypothetical protein